jgi:hypothetical protein
MLGVWACNQSSRLAISPGGGRSEGVSLLCQPKGHLARSGDLASQHIGCRTALKGPLPRNGMGGSSIARGRPLNQHSWDESSKNSKIPSRSVSQPDAALFWRPTDPVTAYGPETGSASSVSWVGRRT